MLKIDRMFVSGLTTHRHDWSIVKGTIELAHALGLLVVAEGVETDEQRHQLVGLGCDRGQGFLWSRPVPADELLAVAERLGLLTLRTPGGPRRRVHSLRADAS